MISQNGIPGINRHPHQKQFVEFHIGSDDLLYKDTFTIPRFGAGGFVKSLLALYKEQYNTDILYKIYGKPTSQIFEYASICI